MTQPISLIPEPKQMAISAENTPSHINPDDPRFLPPGDHPARIRQLCHETGQPIPQTKGAIIRCVLDSLAVRYRDVLQTLQSLANGPIREADLNDRASSETDWGIELRTRDRQRKLVSKIDSALRRIEEGEYGYCEVTGDPIGLRRLIARPVATMTVEAQEAHERREKVSRDD